MGETTGPGATGPSETSKADATAVAGANAAARRPATVVGVGDLPTRMLVFGVARHDGTIAAADAFAVADACQRSTEQVRSCLRRLVSEGLFVRDGTGQRAAYRPTDEGLRALSAMGSRALRARDQDLDRRDWDGRWHLVAFAVPESRRAARDALRDHLGSLGGAPIHNGLYVSPHDWTKDVATAAGDLGVGEHVTLASTDRLVVGGESDARTLARRLWRLDELADRYAGFVDRWSGVLSGLRTMQRENTPLPDTAFLPGALAMAIAYQACFDADPLLPAELLPRPWPGRAARDLLVGSRRLALQIRADGGRPALFATYHELVDTAPGAGEDEDDGGSA